MQTSVSRSDAHCPLQASLGLLPVGEPEALQLGPPGLPQFPQAEPRAPHFILSTTKCHCLELLDFVWLGLVVVTGITGRHHHAWFMQCWELNTGPCACWTIPTDLYPLPELSKALPSESHPKPTVSLLDTPAQGV